MRIFRERARIYGAQKSGLESNSRERKENIVP
jgi:hypothetical protein